MMVARHAVWRAPRGRPTSRTDQASAASVRDMEVIMATGTVKKVVADRGFGFITAEDAKEYFFHRSALDSSLDFDRRTGGAPDEVGKGKGHKPPPSARVRAAGAGLTGNGPSGWTRRFVPDPCPT